MVRDAHLPAPSIKTPQELVEMLKRSVTEFNKWRQSNPDVIITMQGVDFQNCTLTNADLHDARLENANFYLANLNGANLAGAKLDNAKFSHASLLNITVDALNRDVISSQIMFRYYQEKASKCDEDYYLKMRGGNCRCHQDCRETKWLYEYYRMKTSWR
mgnify:FL=1